MFEFKSESEKLVAVISEKLRQKEEQLKESKEKLKGREEELKANQGNFASKIADLKEKHKVSIDELQKALDLKSEQLTCKDKELREAENK